MICISLHLLLLQEYFSDNKGVAKGTKDITMILQWKRSIELWLMKNHNCKVLLQEVLKKEIKACRSMSSKLGR